MRIQLRKMKNTADQIYLAAAKAQCGQTHSGNHALVADQGSWTCQGCGAWYTQEQVMAPTGEMGQGGAVPRTQDD